MRLLYWFIALLMVGCAADTDFQMPTYHPSAPLACRQLNGADVACLEIDEETILLQTVAQQQATVSLHDFRVTFDSTVAIMALETQTFTIVPLDGAAVVAAAGVSRILNAGMQTTVTENSPPSPPEPYEISPLIPVALTLLQNQIVLPAVVETETRATQEEALRQLESVAETCSRPENWTATYTIQRGDTLSRIAALYEVPIAEVQEYNCILNPNRIRPGDVLYVPVVLNKDTNGE